MGTRIRLFQVCAVVLLAVVVSPVHAIWLEDGTEVCTASNTQEFIKACPDGEGGAVFVWRDSRNLNFDIYALRIDADGNMLWTTDGVPVCTQTANQSDHVIVSDGVGGVIVAWTDYRSGTNYDIYAQRLDSDGNPLWTADGVPVVTQSSTQLYLQMATNGAQGAYICWIDQRDGYNNIYIQEIDYNGVPAWSTDGFKATLTINLKTDPAIADDGMGGAYVVWSEFQTGHYDIFGMRIIHGSRSWPTTGLAICTYSYNQYDPAVINDGFGGMIVTWEDYRSGSGYDIWAQRVTNWSTVLWAAGGNPVCLESGNQIDPQLVQDGEAGAIIAWNDTRLSTDEVYAQRISYDAALQWSSSGIRVCYETSDKTDFQMVADGEGGAIFSWTDFRYWVTYDIYAQRLNGSGTILWDSNGEEISGMIFNQMKPAITIDGCNGALIAWQDDRNQSGGYDIFAQRIERNGYWGYPAPVITGIRDVPGDQGSQVYLAWDASRLDIYPEDRIGYYTIWRAIDETAAMAMLESGAVKFEEIIKSRDSGTEASGTLMFEDDPDRNPVVRLGVLAGEPYYWQQIMTVYSSDYVDHYSMTVYTLFDSTDSSNEYHYFQVIAHESDPTEFWVSAVDSAYSVDNLAPAPPLGLAGEQLYSPEGLQLTWDPNSESDLAGYNIYRGVSSDFTPGPGNFVTSTPDTTTLDGDWSWETGYWYKVAAIDIHGNESVFAIFGPDMVTGDDPIPLPDATFLAQNYPNPFNPVTNIRFGLKESGYISLRIYNAAGRLVTTLIDESRPAGSYTAKWNGRDNNGSSAASGVYFYRLNAKEFEETKKRIMLR